MFSPNIWALLLPYFSYLSRPDTSFTRPCTSSIALLLIWAQYTHQRFDPFVISLKPSDHLIAGCVNFCILLPLQIMEINGYIPFPIPGLNLLYPLISKCCSCCSSRLCTFSSEDTLLSCWLLLGQHRESLIQSG